MTSERQAEVRAGAAEIDALDRAGCLDRWREVFGRLPQKYLSPQVMKRVLIWEMQGRMVGGLSARTDRALNRLAAGGTAQPALKPGAHLVREWNGRTYQVEVVEGGFVVDGKTWRSLSALARHITGARWSWQRFFGLT